MSDEKPPVKSYCGGKPNYCTPEVTHEVTHEVTGEAFVLDRGCWERGCVAYDERDGDGVTISAEIVKGENVKVVINRDFGGFSLSDEAIRLYAEKKGLKLKSRQSSRLTNYYFEEDGKFFDDRDLSRDDPILVEIVETLKPKKASGQYASLKVVEIPGDVVWEIKEYDGMEHIAEVHRTWY
jgi:hypothetical protein